MLEATSWHLNCGRLHEAMQYQMQLQQNLLWLGVHADEDPNLEKLTFELPQRAAAGSSSNPAAAGSSSSGAAAGSSSSGAAAAAGSGSASATARAQQPPSQPAEPVDEELVRAQMIEETQRTKGYVAEPTNEEYLARMIEERQKRDGQNTAASRRGTV